MQDFEFMQGFKTLDNLDYYLPDVFFLHELLCRLTITDPLEDISIISKLHYNTKLIYIYNVLTKVYRMVHQKMLTCNL
jgi:hypothetical protein